MTVPIYLPRSGLAGGSRLVPSILAGGPWQGSANDYISRVLALGPLTLWPLDEVGGSVARNLGRLGSAANATYKSSGITYGVPGVDNGRTAIATDGQTGSLNLYSTALRDTFRGTEFSIALWIKIAAAQWNNTASQVLATLLHDGSNKMRLYIGGGVRRISFAYTAGGVLVQSSLSSIDDETWVPVVLTVSQNANQCRLHINGNTALSTVFPAGTWVDPLGSTYAWLGADQPGNAYLLGAAYQDCALFNYALTPQQAAIYSSSAVSWTPSILDIGDSHAANRGWQDLLVDALGVSTGQAWKEAMTAVSSSTSTTWAATIDTVMANFYSNPSVILYNIGVNDGITNEATFKTNTLHILDSLHNRCPGAAIYVARVWKRGTPALVDINAWLDWCIGQRSFTCAGPDESVWSQGADDGATMTTDGLHYSAAGMIECAAQWKTAMGL